MFAARTFSRTWPSPGTGCATSARRITSLGSPFSCTCQACMGGLHGTASSCRGLTGVPRILSGRLPIGNSPWGESVGTHIARGPCPPSRPASRRRSAIQPVRVGRVDTQDAYLGGEEAQFVQGEGDVLLVGVALDLGVEATGVQTRADLVALDLREVHPAGGEPAERLEERAGDVAHGEEQTRH